MPEASLFEIALPLLMFIGGIYCGRSSIRAKIRQDIDERTQPSGRSLEDLRADELVRAIRRALGTQRKDL